MRRLALLGFAVILAAAALAPAVAAGSKPRVFSPKSHPYGKSYGEWQARWTTWFFEIPAATNPLFDETGELCALGQRGPVWLGQPVSHLGTTERSCAIPEGKAFLVPVAGVECSNIEPPPFFGETEAELRACAASGFVEFFSGPMSVTVDGKGVPNLLGFRTQTPVFSFTLPEDNIFGFPGPITATKAVSDGIFVILKPLSEGRHRVVMHGEDSFGGVVDEIYNLTVVDRHEHDDD
jgi:hypothetical protein